MTPDNSTAPRHSPPWIFCLPYIPYGIVGGFAGTVMPKLARDAGIEMDSIGWYAFLVLVPPFVQFLYAPIVDVGPRRRIWVLIVTLLGAACLCGALLMPLPSKINWFLGLTFAAQAVSGLIGSCIGGMIAATYPDDKRGKAGGWLNAGNLGGAALAAWVTVYMTNPAHPASRPMIGLTIASLMIVPALAALFILDGKHEKKPLGVLFGDMLRDVGRVAKSRPGWTGILFCMSPVGTAALVNLFGGMAKDFHAGNDMVQFVNGPIAALLTVVGSLVAGYACDHINRRLAYLLSGALTAAVGLGTAYFPLTPHTYQYGVCAYLFVSGFCYAAFSAVVFEAIGRAGAAASTQYTLFSSAGNFAIAYVGWIDTRWSKTHGPKSPLVVDALVNLVGIVLLSIMIRVLKNRPVEPQQEEAQAA